MCLVFSESLHNTHTTSNVKVSSSSYFSLAFDLSAVLRLPSASFLISHINHQRHIQKTSASAYNGNNGQWLSIRKTNKEKEVTLQNSLFKETALHICTCIYIYTHTHKIALPCVLIPLLYYSHNRKKIQK